MLTKTRPLGFFGLTAAFAALLARSGLQDATSVPGTGSRVKPAPAVKGRLIWDEGTFSAGRNAEKRSAKAHQQERRLAQLRNAGWHEGSDIPLGHRENAPKVKFSARRNLLADRRLRQRGISNKAA